MGSPGGLNPFGFRAGFRTSKPGANAWDSRLNPFGFRAGFRTPTRQESALLYAVLIPLVSGLGSGRADSVHRICVAKS